MSDKDNNGGIVIIAAVVGVITIAGILIMNSKKNSTVSPPQSAPDWNMVKQYVDNRITASMNNIMPELNSIRSQVISSSSSRVRGGPPSEGFGFGLPDSNTTPVVRISSGSPPPAKWRITRNADGTIESMLKVK